MDRTVFIFTRFRRPPLQGEFRWLPDPGLKPWAKTFNRSAVKSDRHLGQATGRSQPVTQP